MPRCHWVGLVLAVAPAAGMEAQDPDGGAPCCAVTGIDTRRGVVTAQEAATGHRFRFEVPDQRILRGLTVGQKLWADFATGRVTTDTVRGPCCRILGAAAAPGLPDPVELLPCCAITGIDRTTHLVTARINASGLTFRFEVLNGELLGNLRAGDPVWANRERREAGLTAAGLCCKIVGPLPPETPDDEPTGPAARGDGEPRQNSPE